MNEDDFARIENHKTNLKLDKIYFEHIKQDLHYIGEILETGDSIFVKNKEIGLISVDKGCNGKSGNGLQHIIEQRFEKDGKSIDEISAVLALVMNATEDGKIARNVEVIQNDKDIGTFDIEKNGIISFVSKTRDGRDEKFVITGFDDFSKKEEAGVAINAVIAENSYAPEFVIVKEQVVATLASSLILHLDEIKRNIEKKDDKKVKQEFNKIKNYENSEELKKYFSDKKQQGRLQVATESLNAVIAQHENVPKFLDIYKQMEPVIAFYSILPQSLEKSIKEHKNVVEVRHISSTAEQGMSDPAAGISTLNDNTNLPQSQEKSTHIKETVSKSTFNYLANEYNGLLKEFDENIKDYNTLLTAYNKVQEENKYLKNQLHSHNKNNSKER